MMSSKIAGDCVKYIVLQPKMLSVNSLGRGNVLIHNKRLQQRKVVDSTADGEYIWKDLAQARLSQDKALSLTPGKKDPASPSYSANNTSSSSSSSPPSAVGSYADPESSMSTSPRGATRSANGS